MSAVAGIQPFERIIDAVDVENAVKAVLDDYISIYLGERERSKGYAPNSIERPRGVITASELDKWPEDQVPVLVVLSAGTGKPKAHERKMYSADWGVGVHCVVSDVNADETRKLGLVYVAAVRAAIVQHGGLGSSLHPDGFAQALSWEGERYDATAFVDTRTIFAPLVMFTVSLDETVTGQAGPREPYTDPTEEPAQMATVTSIKTPVDPVGIGEPFS
jgi:hypothetical protein